MVKTICEVIQTLEEAIDDLNDYDLPNLHCVVGENDIKKTAEALSIFEAVKSESYDKLKAALRDLFVLQTTRESPTPEFDIVIAEHFGDATNDMKSQLLLAYHHIYKYTVKPRSQQLVNIVLSTIGGEEHVLVCDKSASLGDVQKAICMQFGQAFPKRAATLVVNGRQYDEFIQKPFLHYEESTVVNAVFDNTRDPFFYDLRDRRRGSKMTLEEEMLSEALSPLVL